MGVARVREPVPVLNFFQYGKLYPLTKSSRTRFSFLFIREPIPVFNFFQYGKPYPLLTLWTPGDGLPTLRKLSYAARSLLTDGTVYQRRRQETVDRRHGI